MLLPQNCLQWPIFDACESANFCLGLPVRGLGLGLATEGLGLGLELET